MAAAAAVPGLPKLDLALSDSSTVSSGFNAQGSTGSFTYTGPVVNLPSVQRSAGFWATRAEPASVLPAVLSGNTAGIPTAAVLAGAALLAWWLWRRG